mgnify:CR=1 FL=1
MITKRNIIEYNSAFISSGDNHIYIQPHVSLRSYISHYCISFPNQETMPDKYTVLPSANSVLCVFVNNGKINSYYNGTNTKAVVVGELANKNDMLLLVKFRPGGFFPFYGFNQNEFIDFSMDLSNIDKNISQEIENAIVKSEQISELIAMLDCIFLSQLKTTSNEFIIGAIKMITENNGNITAKKLSEELHYSEKHIRRLFLQHIGTSPKKFSRIVRANYASWLLQKNPLNIADVIEKVGYFDQAHFIHDFRDVFNLTPSEYIKNKSVFYNTDSF